MNKKITSIIVMTALTATLGSGCVTADNDKISVLYDGQTIEFDVQPEIIDDSVMVPMRTIFETFGAKVKWDSETQSITAKKKSKTIEMTIGSGEITKNEETYSYNAVPVIEDGRTLVPVRAISELLGLDVDWDDSTKIVSISTPVSEDETWKENTGTINLDDLTVTGDGVNIADNVITILQGGDFEVTGTLSDGQIIVDTEDKVKLRLSGMSLTNTSGSALYVKNADKMYITLTENTENTLTDGEIYTSGDENEKACITSRDNLEIKGNGSLTVNGNYNHGIDSSDSVEIGNGNLTVNAKNDGIHANDTLQISGGLVNVTAEGDGVQADEIVDITGGTVNVTTTGDVPVSANTGFGGRGFGSMAGQDITEMTEEERQTMREEMQKQIQEIQSQETETDNSEDVTSKGIKADWMLDISGGSVTVNSTDHSIHCASDINITGGTIALSSESKKGISAHGDIVIDDGEITVSKSTEGMESKKTITVNGGDIDITASDDGINAGGTGANEMFGGGMQSGEQMTPPNMQSGEQMTPPNMQGGEQMTPPDMQKGGQMTPPDMQGGTSTETQNGDGTTMKQGGMGHGGMGGNMNSNEIDSEHHIQINGGTIYINAAGDGIDSNGSLVIDGGYVVVDGTTNGGNSALDTNAALMINGGEVVAISAVGMVEAPNSYSKQNVLNYTLSASVEAGKGVELKNSKGETIISHTPAKAYQSFIYSSDKLKTGEEYTIYVDGEQQETFTVSDVINAVGNSQNQSGGFGGGRGNHMERQTQTVQ